MTGVSWREECRRRQGRRDRSSDLCPLPSVFLMILAAGGGVERYRAISTGRLRGLPRFHPRPINVVVYHGSQARPGFEEGFPLRCVQRLSRPHLATRRCGWRHNRYTRGASLPVLSY